MTYSQWTWCWECRWGKRDNPCLYTACGWLAAHSALVSVLPMQWCSLLLAKCASLSWYKLQTIGVQDVLLFWPATISKMKVLLQFVHCSKRTARAIYVKSIVRYGFSLMETVTNSENNMNYCAWLKMKISETVCVCVRVCCVCVCVVCGCGCLQTATRPKGCGEPAAGGKRFDSWHIG